MSSYGRARARHQLFAGPYPVRRCHERRSGGLAWVGLVARAIAHGRLRHAMRLAVLALCVLVGSLVALWPTRADAETTAVEAEVIPAGLPTVLEPFVSELEHDGFVSDADAALLPYQRAWAYDRSQLKVAAKSRRVGITWATAYEAVEVAASSAASGGMDVWYMANALDDARVFIDDCADWVRWLSPLIGELASATAVSEELIADEKNDILAFTIRFASGFSIHALTSKPRRLRGKEGYAILDEAAFHDNLGEWIKAAGAFVMWGGRVAIISTYNGVENDFYDLVEEIRAGKRKGRLHEIDIFDALKQGLYRRIARVRLRKPWTAEGEIEWLEQIRAIYRDNFDEECGCIPSKSGGAYIAQHIIHGRMTLRSEQCRVVEFKPSISLDKNTWGGAESWEYVPVAERQKAMRRWLDAHVGPHLRKLKDVELYGGVDFGRVANLTVLHLVSLKRDMTRQSRLVIELDNVPHNQQDQVLDYVWERCPRIRKVCLDSLGLGGPSAEHARDTLGSRAEQVKLSEGWYAEHWPALKTRFEDGAIELPMFEPLFADLRSLRRVGGKVKIVGDKSSKTAQTRHGDGAIALLLAEAAVGSKVEAANTSAAARWGVKAKKRGRRR